MLGFIISTDALVAAVLLMASTAISSTPFCKPRSTDNTTFLPSSAGILTLSLPMERATLLTSAVALSKPSLPESESLSDPSTPY